MVGTGQLGLGKDEDGGLAGGTDGGGGGDGWEDDEDRINWWEDTLANVILGTDNNAPLSSAPGLEIDHPIVSVLGGTKSY